MPALHQPTFPSPILITVRSCPPFPSFKAMLEGHDTIFQYPGLLAINDKPKGFQLFGFKLSESFLTAKNLLFL